MLVVERHYLRAYGGGFTENFYGLKRERVLRIKGGEAPRASIGTPELMRETLRLKESDVWKNLAVMIGLPYIKRKLDESRDIHVPQASILGPQYNRDLLPPNATVKQRIIHCYKWFLRNVYPSFNAAYHFSLLAFNLAYLFDNTKYSSPLLWLIGTRIRRMGQADYRAIAVAEQSSTASTPRPGARPGQAASVWNPATFTSIIFPRLLSSLRLLLPTSIFALKFLEWWHASDFARQLSRKAVEGLDLPPPIISGMPPKKSSTTSPSKTKISKIESLPSKLHTNTVSLSSSHSKAVPSDSAATSLGTPPSHSPPNPPKPPPPISSTSHLPILTVPNPTPQTSSLCPICLSPIETPTSAQTGYVFCYSCIFKWVDGSHERQAAFMGNGGGEEGWGEDDDFSDGSNGGDRRGREGKWESGQGRCAVTGRRVLGGTEGLRRVMV